MGAQATWFRTMLYEVCRRGPRTSWWHPVLRWWQGLAPVAAARPGEALAPRPAGPPAPPAASAAPERAADIAKEQEELSTVPTFAEAKTDHCGLLQEFVQGLRRNRRQVAAQAFREQAQNEVLLARRRQDIIDEHAKRGYDLIVVDFEAFKGMWMAYAELERKACSAGAKRYSRHGAHIDLPGSQWDPKLLAQYVDRFRVLPWCTNHRAVVALQLPPPWRALAAVLEDDACFHVEMLEVFLEQTVQDRSCSLEMFPVGAPVAEELFSALAESLHVVLRGLGVGDPHGRSRRETGGGGRGAEVAANGGIAGGSPLSTFPGRLKALAGHCGAEAVSRTIVDAVLLPLCARLGIVANLEERAQTGEENPLPAHRCDYVLRRRAADYGSGQPLGAVEVKRCCATEWPKALAQGVAQRAMQLLTLYAAAGPPRQGRKGRPLLVGLVADGRRWVVVELRPLHFAVTPVLDVMDEKQLRLLLCFLTERLLHAT